MNNDCFISDNQEGVPDAEMPELQEQDFARARPNRFAKGISKLDKDLKKAIKDERLNS